VKPEVDTKVSTFSAWSQAVAIRCAELTHAIGLNDVCDTLRHHGWLVRIVGATALNRNGQTYAGKHRDAVMAEKLFLCVLGAPTKPATVLRIWRNGPQADASFQAHHPRGRLHHH